MKLAMRVIRVRNATIVSYRASRPIDTFHTSECQHASQLSTIFGRQARPQSSFAFIEDKNLGNRSACSKRRLSSVPESIEKWWEESTTKFLDQQRTPLGSIDSLAWHKAECMLIYWAELGKPGLEYCFQILDRMIEEASSSPDADFSMNIYLIHAVLLSWRSLFQKFETDLLPSQILAKIDAYQSQAPSCFVSNIVTYTIILDGAATCPNPAERIIFSEDLLGRLMAESKNDPGLRPTEVTIGTVIKAWARSGSIAAAEKSESLLRQILLLRETEEPWRDLKINTILYTSVVSAYANAGEPEPAQRLVREMYEEYLVHGNSDVRPNLRSFNTVLSAWGKSSDSNAFEHAEELIVKMGELHESGALDDPPDIVSYNYLLKTLEKSRRRENAVEKAEALLNDVIRLSISPDLVSFTALFRILAASNHPKKAETGKYWLAKAKELGVRDERLIIDQYQTKLLHSERGSP